MPLNPMQANAGFMPYGTPDLPPLVFPMGMPAPQVASPGQVSAMLQQQMYAQQYAAPQPSMMMGGTMMQGPFRGGYGGPPSMFGRANMARQAGISMASTITGGAEAGMGLATMGLTAAGSAFGPLGAGIGFGVGMGVDMLSSAAFGAVNAQRERALALQNSSLGYVVGGNMLSQTGQGMGMQQARMISSGLGRMADSASFKADTSGMLNRGDLDRLTRIAGESGMLNQAQSPQQVLDAVRKISKQVTTFMSVLEEPDFQKAMQRMGQLHQLGVRIGDMTSVAANTRTFARMAGVTADQAMGVAMQHAQGFQQAGLSAANGINASLGAQGFGRQISGLLDARTLSMMGGTEGVQNSLMAATTQTFSNPLLMASVLRRGRNGHLEANSSDFLEAISGPNASISDITRRGASNLRGLGGRRAISEVLSNSGHLRDQLMDGMSPEQMMLVNLRMAQLQQHQAGGSLEENVMRITGNEETTRAMMTQVRDPRFFANVRNQMRISGRDRAVGRRDRMLESQGGWMQRAWDENVANPISHELGGVTEGINRYLARQQERTESLALQGAGRARALDGDNYATEVFTGSVQDSLAATGARGRGVRSGMASARREAGRLSRLESQRNYGSIWGDMGGADGFGFTAAQRGGDSVRQVVLDGGSTRDRFADSFANSLLGMVAPGMAQQRVSVGGIERMARDQMGLADVIQRSQGTVAERTARERAAMSMGPGGGSSASALHTATEAARSYFGSREGMFGTQGELSQSGMMSRARAALVRSGVSEGEATRMLASSDFQASIIQGVRSTANAETTRQLDRATQQGSNVRDSLHGRSSSSLREIVSQQREKVRETLGLDGGLFGMGQASDADVGRLSNVLTATGNQDEDQLKQKLLTAYAMSQSEDPATRSRGTAELDRLRQGNPQATELFESVVKPNYDRMDDGAKEALSASYEGKSFEGALRQTASAAEGITRAANATAEIAQQDVLGEAGSDSYGEGRDVGRLRRNASQVRSRRIRNMLQDGRSSDSDVERAIAEETRNAAAGASASQSVGAGEDESGSEGATDRLITDIQSGMEQFPEATHELSSAAAALLSASEALRDAMGAGAIQSGITRAN